MRGAMLENSFTGLERHLQDRTTGYVRRHRLLGWKRYSTARLGSEAHKLVECRMFSYEEAAGKIHPC